LATEFTAGDFLVEELLGDIAREPLSNLEQENCQMSSPRQSIDSGSSMPGLPSVANFESSNQTSVSEQTERSRFDSSQSVYFKEELSDYETQPRENSKTQKLVEKSGKRNRRSPKSSNRSGLEKRVIKGHYRHGEASPSCSETNLLDSSLRVVTDNDNLVQNNTYQTAHIYHVNNSQTQLDGNSVQIISPSNYFLSSQPTSSRSSGFEDNLGEITLKSNLQQHVEYSLVPFTQTNN